MLDGSEFKTVERLAWVGVVVVGLLSLGVVGVAVWAVIRAGVGRGAESPQSGAVL